MSKDWTTITAENIISGIVVDISGRMGLGQEWKSIESEIVYKEIFPAWREIIIEQVRKELAQESQAREEKLLAALKIIASYDPHEIACTKYMMIRVATKAIAAHEKSQAGSVE